MEEQTKALRGARRHRDEANTGIGLVTARELGEDGGARVFVACRSEDQRARRRRETNPQRTLGARWNLCRSTSGISTSVRRCAEGFLSKDLPLHLLVNNAGLAGQRGLSKSGFEVAFGVNHVGHFLLTTLLLDRIRRSAPARIVTVASKAHYRATGIDFDAVRKTTATRTAL